MTVHVPILVDVIVEALLVPFLKVSQEVKGWLVDATLGGGGHTDAFLKLDAFKKHCILGVDQDFGAIQRAQKRFAKEIEEKRLVLYQGRWSELKFWVQNHYVLGCIADLGFSSDQLADPKRGISFQIEAPLDMRMDTQRGLTCYELLRDVTEKELMTWLQEGGEERFAKRIAHRLIQSREQGRLPQTTQGLVQLIVQAVPLKARHGRLHIATRTFQALRRVVNQEALELESLLRDFLPQIRSGGRVAILSFHSLEDRQVKQGLYQSSHFFPLIKKPLQVDQKEFQMNPRSRSAKLRIAERNLEGKY